MILGEFLSDGTPIVEGFLTLPRFNVTKSVRFLVDTGAYATCIHPRDSTQISLPFDLLERPVRSDGVGGMATYFLEPAILEFVDGDAREIHRYEIDTRIAKPAPDPRHSINRLHSLLGRDMIDRWRMLYDRTDNLLTFMVRTP
ncbi:MAG: hypothetical protein F4X64_07850 [Chloroflexi bacterium]|nr:hypothetical protein [Chloroflexota bacterium]